MVERLLNKLKLSEPIDSQLVKSKCPIIDMITIHRYGQGFHQKPFSRGAMGPDNMKCKQKNKISGVL